MPSQAAAQSIEMSREFFERPASYSGFSLTADKRNIVACIEPKDPEGVEPGKYKVAIQTPGGGPGEGLDNALALTVVEGELVTPEQGMARDRDDRQLTVFGAHYRCAFIAGLPAVLAEMAEPSDHTSSNIDRWARYLNHEEALNPSFLGAVIEASKVEVDYIQTKGSMGHLVEHVDGLYPEHTNVGDVRGDGPGHVWVTNLHPNVGQNRNKKPSDPDEAMQVRGYHDSLAASVIDLQKALNLPRRVRGLRLSAMLLRSAATRTVITQDRLEEMAFLEVRPADTRHGIEVVEEGLSLV